MITRRPKNESAEQRRARVIASNIELMKVEARGVSPNDMAKVLPKKKAAPKSKKGQTKKPSEQKKELQDKLKEKERKLKAKQKAQLEHAKKKAKQKAKPKVDNESKRKKPRSGGSGSTKKEGAKKRPIRERWDQMSSSQRSAYIQSHANANIGTADADKALRPVWSKMTPRQQAAHKKRHPQTSLKMKGEKRERAPVQEHHAGSEEQQDEQQTSMNEQPGHEEGHQNQAGPEDHRDHQWWREQTPEYQQKYLRDYPNSKFALHHRNLAHSLVYHAGQKIRDSVKKIGRDYHQGMSGLRAFRSGAAMTDEQKEGLKHTAIKVGSGIALALMAVAFFTPLGAVAMEIGSKWFEELEKRAEDAVRAVGDSDNRADNAATAGVNLEGHESADPRTQEAHQANEDQLKWMMKDMTKFILRQRDLKKFAASLQSK